MDADAWSSLAFVAAGLWVVVRRHRPGPDGRSGDAPRTRAALGVLAILVGVGSVLQHGPAPAWNPLLHDPPLLGVYALVAADAVADLTGRPLRTWWWLAPTLADVALAAVVPAASMVAQATAAAVAIVATLTRAAARPALRARLLTAVAVLGVGGSFWFVEPWGHGVWHALAAVAIAVVAPAVGWREVVTTGPAGRP
ncbi:hypothetical protein [Isoptericola croceus]|uniref:hypothetical protein n=1 Tax=Isoptericola croceus TaxID=3031406 RepID=UPI0023F841F4|nr:hypothetical protein [Isoptericola croceus]